MIYPRQEGVEGEGRATRGGRGRPRGGGEEPRDRKRRESRNAFSSFSPSGHQFEAPAIRASRSQTKSHGFTYYDLHPCPLPLFYSFSSRLAPPPFSFVPTARNRRPLLSRPAASLARSFSRSPFCLLHVSFDIPFARFSLLCLEKCHFTDVSDSPGLSLSFADVVRVIAPARRCNRRCLQNRG